MHKKRHILVLLMISIPCTSFTVFNTLVRTACLRTVVPSRLMARTMATLSTEKRVLYQQRLAELESDLQEARERGHFVQDRLEKQTLLSLTRISIVDALKVTEMNAHTQALLKQNIFDIKSALHTDPVVVDTKKCNPMAF